MVAADVNQNLDTVAILGGGMMGSGIAQVCLGHGFKVSLYGRSEAKLVEAQKRIKWGLEKNAARKLQDKEEVSQLVNTQMSSFSIHTSIEQAVASASFIIEAVPEDLQLKRNIFNEVQKYSQRSAYLITNTSSIRLRDMSDDIKYPENFAGLHFFNPVPLLKLVEVISTDQTSQKTKDDLFNFCRSIGKLPVACKDTPGFIVNRLLVPYLIESIRMVERGDATKEDIDTAMKCGTSYPMGPLELCDYVGLDTLQNVMKVWRESMPGDARFEPCGLLDHLVDEGKLGKKSKEGFYSY